MTDWRKIIEENEEQIREELKKVEVDAYLNNHMRFSLYIDTDGDFSILEDTAGGNSFYSSENLFCLHTAEHQCYDVLSDGYGGDVKDLSRELSYGGVDADKLIADFIKDMELGDDDDINDYLQDFIAFCDKNYSDKTAEIRKEMAENEAEESLDAMFDNILDSLEQIGKYA